MSKDKTLTKLGGHRVIYATGRDGLGIKSWDKLEDKSSGGDEWPRGPFWVVTSNDIDGYQEMKVFSDEKDATRYAKAASQGNVDHRVLEVVSATLVVATRNEL